MALSAALGGGFYIVVIYLVAYLQKVEGITASMAFRYNTLTLLILLAVATISAWLSDKIGRKVVIIAGLLVLLIFVWPLFSLIVSGNATRAIIGQMGLAALLAIYSGPVPAAMVEMFRPNARCSALALSYNVSQGFIGGTAPMIATYLVKGAGFEMGPAVYLMCLAGIALVAALTMTERSGQPLR